MKVHAYIPTARSNYTHIGHVTIWAHAFYILCYEKYTSYVYGHKWAYMGLLFHSRWLHWGGTADPPFMQPWNFMSFEYFSQNKSYPSAVIIYYTCIHLEHITDTQTTLEYWLHYCLLYPEIAHSKAYAPMLESHHLHVPIFSPRVVHLTASLDKLTSPQSPYNLSHTRIYTQCH